MDSDCLIKLTKAGLKELVCSHYRVTVPQVVYDEVVVSGGKAGCLDAQVVKGNIEKKMLKVAPSSDKYSSGDDALLRLFSNKFFSVVATDDVKLTKKLRASGIPFILPALILYKMAKDKHIAIQKAAACLDKLAGSVSDGQLSMVKILLENL